MQCCIFILCVINIYAIITFLSELIDISLRYHFEKLLFINDRNAQR